MAATRVLLVDENDDFLDALAAWLAGAADVEVVGRVHEGREAIDRIRRLGPEVVVMDVMLPDMSGLEATREIKAAEGAPLVVLMMFHESRVARAEAIAAGADHCLSKLQVTGLVLPVIRQLVKLRGALGAAGTDVQSREPERPSTRVVEGNDSRIPSKERRKS